MYTWPLAEQIGYKPITTFWNDFSIADRFGKTAVQETAQRVFNEWKNDYKFLTEFILVLNHKSWQYAKSNPEMSSTYSELYYKYDAKAIKALEYNKVGLNYYFTTLD